MSAKLSVIVAYHTTAQVDRNVISYECSRFSDDILIINNDDCRSSTLQKLMDMYNPGGIHKGVVFDEFNSHSYFVDELNKDSEYVYTTQYHRFIYFPHVKNLILQPDVIYTVVEDMTFNTYNKDIVHFWFQKSEKFLDEQRDECEKIFMDIIRDMFNADENMMNELMDNTYYCKEMYIMHRYLQWELVHSVYVFIDMCCWRFPKCVLDSPRIIGFLIELYHSFFIASKEIKGYNVIPRPYVIY